MKVKELPLIIIAALLSASPASAGGSPYPPPKNFMPLPDASTRRVQTITTAGKPAKFFALAPSRFVPPVRRDTKDIKIMPVAKDERFPPEPAAGKTKKTNMTQEQAKQIISIFAMQ